MREDDARLGEHHVARTSLQVLPPRAHEPRDHRRAKHGLVGRQWIGDAHSCHLGAQKIEIAVTTERGRPAFGGAEVDDDVAHVPAQLLLLAQSSWFRPGRRVAGQPAIAVKPGNLLDNVSAAGHATAHIWSCTGWHHRKAPPGHAHVESKSGKNRRHLVTSNGDAEDSLNVALVEFDRRWCGRDTGDVERVAEPFQLGTTLAENVHESSGGAKREPRIDAAFETVRAFRTQSVAF